MKLLLFLLASLLPLISFSQTYYGVWEDQPNSIYYFASVDAPTGTMTQVSPLPSVTGYIGPGTSTIKTSTNEYIFRGFTNSGNKLYSIDLVTGLINTSPALTENVVGLEYHCHTDTVYGIWEDAMSVYHLVWLDPVTAAYGSIGSISGMTGYLGGTFTISTHNDHYNFLGWSASGQTFYSIDIHSGNVSSVPFSNNVHGHQYNCTNDTIYARWEEQSTGDYYLVSVDPIAGTMNPINAMPGLVSGFVIDAYGLTADSNQYGYVGYGIGPGPVWINIDTQNGSVISTAASNFPNIAGLEPYNCCPPDSNATNPPVASYSTNSSDTICEGDSITFTVTTANVDSVSWAFQGGSPTTSLNFSETVLYTMAGALDVSLTVFTAGGSNQLFQSGIIIVENCSAFPPVADFNFSADTVCLGDSITFFDLSVDANTWDWSFPGGNPGSSTSSGPITVFYDTIGTYSVGLTVTNNAGSNLLEITNAVTVTDCSQTPPTAAFTSNYTDTICIGDSILFESSGTGATSWFWSFSGGSPTTSIDAIQSVVFNSAGEFDISLDVTNAAGSDDLTESGYVIVKDCATGIRQPIHFEQVSIYPNPTNGFLNIKTELSENTSFSMYNQLGQPVLKGALNTPITQLNLTDFSSGIYFLQLELENQVKMIKIVHQNPR